MNPIFIIIPIVIVVGVVYMYLMNKKHKEAKSEIDINSERKNYEIYKKQLLGSKFSMLSSWMDNKHIDAFTAGSFPKSENEQITQAVGDGVKNIALSAVGVRLNRVDTPCYWILSGDEFHFLTTNTQDELEEHLMFDRTRLESAKMQFGGVLKSQLGFYSKASEEYLPKVHLITFNIDGTKNTYEIHDRLIYTPNQSDLLNVKKQFTDRASYQVVGEKVVNLLMDKYPNLRTY